MRGKTPLTGYHFGLWTTMVSVFLSGTVIPFLLTNKPFPASIIAISLTELGTILLVEDALWFCLNYRSPVNHFGGSLSQYKGYVVGGSAVCVGGLIVYASTHRSALHALAVFATHAAVVFFFCAMIRFLRPMYKKADQEMYRIQASQNPEMTPSRSSEEDVEAARQSR